MGAHRTTSAPTPSSAGEIGAPVARRREVLGLITAALAVLAVLSLFSYDARGGENLVGPVGSGVAGLLVGAFGIAGWVIPAEFSLVTWRIFRGRTAVLGVATVVSTLVIVLIGCGLLHLALFGTEVYGGHLPGGVLGEVLGEILRSLFGEVGAYVVGVTILLVTLVLRTPVSVAASLRSAYGHARSGVLRAREGAGALAEAWREARELERQEREARELAEQPRILEDEDTVDSALDLSANADADEANEDDDVSLTDEDDSEDDAEDAANEPEADATVDEDEEPEATDAEAEAEAPKKKRRKKKEDGPRIIAPVATAKKSQSTKPKPTDGSFDLPELDLLDNSGGARIRVDPAVLRENAKRLTEKLESYGVKGRVDEIHPGPVVTMYEFEPKSGTKISKIAGLENDLALALAAQKVRIVAPIPGKARVGIELPNEDRQTVFLREILEDDRWDKHDAKLPFALGKDIAGQPVYGDLAKMPHLLVAGATGAGKSVGLNVMLASLLYKKTPEDVRLLMIDPKVVELKIFNGIPHMLLPVVTDMNKAALALKWAVDEMERRYQMFADAGARNISSYNRRVEKCLAGQLPVEKILPRQAGKIRGVDEDGNVSWCDPTEGETPTEVVPEKLPYIVVVVDEFADLMMVAAKDVEACVARLAQKARAAGIHVILATQRPSVDVITGMIKANFPARMAFKVSQREDSKTILGRVGAQNLLGRGDMLMIPPGSSDLHRVHCAFISEEEVEAMCDFLRTQGKPVYDESILQPRDEGGSGGGSGGNSDDPQYDKAIAVVANAGYCSISHLQRQLSIGYNKAAKLVERMEKDGVVGPPSKKAGGRREVLVSPL